MQSALLVLTATQLALLSITPVDKKNNPAQVDGVPQWNVADPNVATLKPGVDGLSCEVIANGTGTTQVSVTADADLGEGNVSITGTIDIQVIAGQAASLAIAAGAPVEQEEV